LILAELARVSHLFSEDRGPEESSLRAELQRVDRAIRILASGFRSIDAEKINALYERAKSSGSISLHGRDRNLTRVLLNSLPEAERDNLAETLRKAREENLKQLPLEAVFTESRKEALFGGSSERPTVDEVREVFSDFGLSEAVHQQSISNTLGGLAVLRDVYTFCSLSEADLTIRPERIANSEATVLLDRLQKYYRESNFGRDLETLRIVIAGRSNPLRGRHVGLIVTDNPQAMLQLGEYPAGSGSCQAVSAEASTSKALTGTIGASHIKVGFMIDMDRLSPELRAKFLGPNMKLTELEFDWNEVLDAAIARELIKTGTVAGKPCVAGVNTYTPLKTGDDAWERLYDRGIDEALARPMGISLARIDQTGEAHLALGGIESPGGSYEDGSVITPSGEGGHFVTSAYEVRAVVLRDRSLVQREVSEG
jgi:hypothetical protein